MRCNRVRYYRPGKAPQHPECQPCRGIVKTFANRTKKPRRARPRGDRWQDKAGYWVVRLGYGRGARVEYEHRLVAERVLGRALRVDEVVHHINENKQDNRPENLEVMSRGAHVALHNAKSPKRRRAVQEAA